MLERAAATFETAKLQRVLPRATHHSRKHAAGFPQQHGRLLTGLPRSHSRPSSHQAAPPDTEPHPQHACPRGESTDLLDFLYPKPTHALLRQNRHDLARPRKALNVLSRIDNPCIQSPGGKRFNSNGTAKALDNTEDNLDGAESQQPEAQLLSVIKNGKAESQWDLKKELRTKDLFAIQDEKELNTTVDAVALTAEEDVNRLPSPSFHSISKSLNDLLADPDGNSYHDAWDLYCRLNMVEQILLRPRVVTYLSRSRSVVEAGRSNSLIRQVELEQWDDEFLSSAVLVYLRSDQQQAALDIFKSGVDAKGLVGGIEYLIVDSVNKQQWAVLLDAWITYCEHCASMPGNTRKKPDEHLLSPLSSLSNLGALYYSFERYLAKDRRKVERQLDRSAVSKSGLRILRRRFAEEALAQLCPPSQASTILAFWRDGILYDHYLTNMLDQWYMKKISKATARTLLGIYQAFRKLPGAKPSHAVLRGVFKLQFHDLNPAPLEQLRGDWIRFWGELSQWAYEKYLKLYAFRGDVDRVRQLWDSYVQQYPSSVETPRGFRSTMNVYAQNGDIAGAEKELDRIINRYNVEPDLDIHNTLLKCYMRANDYQKVLAYFGEISEEQTPDSFTYAHVMAMASKLGDLDTTIEFFNKSQENHVPLSREIGLSLVVAYCKNDGLVEAENICVELAQRGACSTAIWNQLLHYNGMYGRLSKCYLLLNQMKQHGFEWDQDTIGCLLRALIRVNQVGPAFVVVRDAVRDGLRILQPDHFSMVMSGAARSGDRGIAESLMRLMEENSIPVPFNAKVAHSYVSLKAAPNTTRTPAMIKSMVASLRPSDPNAKLNVGDIRRRKQDAANMGRAVLLLTEFRQFVTVGELLTIFTDMFPQYKTGEPMPQDIVSALMLAYHRDENYDRVHEVWRAMWPKILDRYVKLGTNEIYPTHQYDVTMIISRLAQTFAAQKDGDGLAKVVKQVTQVGFKLTSNTWDRVIRCLAQFGQWETAMDWCERLIMPQWRGMNPPKPPLNRRREQMHPSILHPRKPMIMALQKEWMEARKLGAWSGEMSRKLMDMEEKYPLLHRAFAEMKISDQSDRWVFGSEAELDKAISALLRPLPLAELLRMEKALEKQIKLKQLDAGPDDTHFLRVDEESRTPMALQRAELQQLRSVLQTTLSAKQDAEADDLDELDEGDEATVPQ